MNTEETTTTTTEAPKPCPATTKRAKKAGTRGARKASKSVTGTKLSGKAETKSARKKATPADKEGGRASTKKAIVLEMLRRKEGATVAEIAKATDWQNHTIRGFISGTVAKMGLEV